MHAKHLHQPQSPLRDYLQGAPSKNVFVKSTLQIPGFAGEAGTPTHPASYVTNNNFALQSPPIKGEGIESMLCKMCFPGSKLSPQSIKSTLCNLLTVVALSVHKYVSISTTASRYCVSFCFSSLFEGMAIGLEQKESGVWQLFMAVAIHGLVICYL